MPVVMMVDNPNGTAELYDNVRAELRQDRAAGGIFHVAGPSPDGGFRVIEVWESQEQAERFNRERLRPALEAAGTAAPPPRAQFWPVHNYMT
jgi:hypothetical protein